LLAPVALAILIGAIIVVVVKIPGGSGPRSAAAKAAHVRRLPPYWIVHRGDTLTQISVKTGLPVADLEAYNPQADPNTLVPGERLNLWRHPPTPHRKPPGPQFWTVHPGDSLGLIAAKTHVDLGKLDSLNPNLSSATLQPGDRVKLRP
jgi:LysM repeat protein